MPCKYLTVRTKDHKKYNFCRLNKQKIKANECSKCTEKDYKKTKQIQTKVKSIKKKSNKLKRLEDNRYSILTDNLESCYICTKSRKHETHEVFGGSNRQMSMKWGLTIPICRECHNEWDINRQLRKKIQEEAKQGFYKKYSQEKFLEEFGKYYI